jgi:hypothetical protein
MVGMPTLRRLLLLCLPVLAGLAVGAWLLWLRSAITRENAAKVQVGMTLAEVEAILGGPARDESTGPTERDDDPGAAGPGGGGVIGFAWALGPSLPDGNPSDLRKMWATDHLMVVVAFNGGGRVTAKRTFQTHLVQEPLLERLRRWLGL